MLKRISGHLGVYGGRYIPEILMPTLIKIDEGFQKLKEDEEFNKELNYLYKNYVGRETPLYYAENFSKRFKDVKIYLKREDLNHTGSHKINNVLGQLLLAKNLGYTKVIAETGAGQHGVATATGAALFGMECRVFMGADDVERQALNVTRMELLGAEVISVTSGSRTLKDATNEAIREWTACFNDTFYCIGSVVGPHPYPEMVQHFQSVIGKEARKQILEQSGKLPDTIIAAVGGGSNAAGIFDAFLTDEEVALIGVEAGGEGLESGKHGAALTKGKIGVFQGMKTYLLQDDYGNILEAHSISAGLDYPGVGPLHAYLKDTKRAEYVTITDHEALEAFMILSRTEGIIPALESSHALAQALKEGAKGEKKSILVCLSGRGDKDVGRLNKLKEIMQNE